MTAYDDPYLAGVGLGAVLLGAYVVVGHGLGASGAFASVVAAGTAAAVGAARASALPAVAPYLPQGITSFLRDWFVLELVGVPGRLLFGLARRPSACLRGACPASQQGSANTRRSLAACSWRRCEVRARFERSGADRGHRCRQAVDLHRDVLRVGLRRGAVRAEALAVTAPLRKQAHSVQSANCCGAAHRLRFGWFPERGGLGHAPKLAGQFY
jgi:hypothetical protein